MMEVNWAHTEEARETEREREREREREKQRQTYLRQVGG